MSSFVSEKRSLLSVKAFVYSASDEDIGLAKDILQKMKLSPGEIVDLRSLVPKIDPANVLHALAFGARAHSRAIQLYPALHILQLPDLPLLKRAGGNEQARLEAFQKLKDLGLPERAEPAPDSLDISANNLPPVLERSNLKKLYSVLVQSNVNYWCGTTRDGKTIKVTLTPQPTDGKFDIMLTFEELLIILDTISVFDLEKVTIVKADRENSGVSSDASYTRNS